MTWRFSCRHPRSDQRCAPQPRSRFLVPATHRPLSRAALRPRPLWRCSLAAARRTALRARAVPAGFVISAARDRREQERSADGGRELEAVAGVRRYAGDGDQCQVQDRHGAIAAASEGVVRTVRGRWWRRTQLMQSSRNNTVPIHGSLHVYTAMCFSCRFVYRTIHTSAVALHWFLYRSKLNPLYNASSHLVFPDKLIYLIIRRCARTGAFPGAFCVPNSVALASLTLQVVNWAIH